jgi:predicted nuclease of predicted toxin-antitoxin system
VAKLYADEQYPLPVVEFLRALGHDVLTVQAAGQAGLRIPDDEVLAFATRQGRAVLTLNRQDFKQLHRLQPNHGGIINCTNDRNWEALANRVDAAILAEAPLAGKLVRVIRPASSPQMTRDSI